MTPYYSDERVTLYHGKWEDVLPALADQSVDHVITDPPYSRHVHSNVRSQRMQSANDRGGRYGADTRRNVDLGFDHLTAEERAAVALEFARLARRWVLTFCDAESSHLWQADLVGAGLDYVRTGVWIKLGATPQFSGDRPATGHENIVLAHPKGRKRWNGGGRHFVYQHPIVLDRGRNGARLHPTQKPENLMLDLIADLTEPGETILDAYAGSGTTLYAAARIGRRAIGCERKEEHAETIAKRLSSAGFLDFGEVTA